MYTCVFLPSTCAVPSLELCTCIHTINFNACETANQSVVLACCCVESVGSVLCEETVESVLLTLPYLTNKFVMHMINKLNIHDCTFLLFCFLHCFFVLNLPYFFLSILAAYVLRNDPADCITNPSCVGSFDMK